MEKQPYFFDEEKMKKYNYIFTFLFIAIIISIIHFTNVNAEVDWIFIGDSYFTVGQARGENELPDFIAKEIGVKNYKNYSHGGYGAARKSGNFLMLLNKMREKKVRNIMFFGGISNDRRSDKTEIQSAISVLRKVTKEKFPKAKVWYVIGNWHSNKTEGSKAYHNRVNKRISWYRKACKENDIIFINVTYALKKENNKQYFLKDGHHPSIKGKRKLAKEIAKKIKVTQQEMYREEIRNTYKKEVLYPESITPLQNQNSVSSSEEYTTNDTNN